MDTTARIPILVTGGAGYIGSQTCKALAKAGFFPVVLDNLSLGHRSAVRWGPLEVLDLHDTTGVARVIARHRIQSVIHFAASAYVGESITDPGFYYRNNVVTTLSLLNAMTIAGARKLVFSSSCAVYGTPGSSPIDESHPLNPISPYGQTKLDCENMIRWFARAHELQVIALRYFNAAGADPEGEIGEDHTPETRLVPRAILAALDPMKPLDIYGTDYGTADGTAIRDYVHVADLASAHVNALARLPAPSAFEAINVGTGIGSSVADVIRTVEAISGRKVSVRKAARREGDPAYVVADSSASRNRLDWIPRHSSLETIVRTAWNWHACRGDSSDLVR